MIKVDIDGAHELDIALDKSFAVLNDLSKYWPKVAEAFYAIEKEQFETEGGRVGRKWAPLTRNYQAWKQSHLFGDTGSILRLRGVLRRSLTARGEEGAIYEETPQSLTLGSSVPYALVHQRGSSARHLPPRPPIQLIGTDAKKLRAAFADQIQRDVRKHWRNPAAVAEDFYADILAGEAEMADGAFIE